MIVSLDYLLSRQNMGLLIPPPSASVYEAQSLPRDFYIDPDEFEFEKDSIFRQK